MCSTPYQLPRIPYLRLRATLHAREAASLPRFKGSLLRGAFGHALRQAVCAVGPDQPCATCRLRGACIYPRLFETLAVAAPPMLRGLATPPRPYVIEPASQACEFAPGSPLAFDLILFGVATDLSPYAHLAIERMADAGLGDRRRRFTLAQIEALRPCGTWQPLPPDAAVQPAPSWLPAPDARLGRQVILRFATPLRVKGDGALRTGLTPRQLVFAMVRRMLELAYFHVPAAAIDWTFRPVLDAATKVEIVRQDLVWQDLQRYSNRQQKKMTLGGLVGTLEIAGEIEPLGPLLRAAEVLHVGKGATFGMGKVELET